MLAQEHVLHQLVRDAFAEECADPSADSVPFFVGNVCQRVDCARSPQPRYEETRSRAEMFGEVVAELWVMPNFQRRTSETGKKKALP